MFLWVICRTSLLNVNVAYANHILPYVTRFSSQDVVPWSSYLKLISNSYVFKLNITYDSVFMFWTFPKNLMIIWAQIVIMLPSCIFHCIYYFRLTSYHNNINLNFIYCNCNTFYIFVVVTHLPFFISFDFQRKCEGVPRHAYLYIQEKDHP